MTTHSADAPTGRRLAFLSFTALGVVYGDIGTSPLYALRECFSKEYGIHPTPENILGVLSLIFWSLILVVSVKYVAFVMRADNRGEGGILALLALLLKTDERRGIAHGRTRLLLVALGLFGAALLYGDGVITPAISVLSALEGVDVATPALQHLIVPLALAIIFGLFLVQRFGTARVGGAFGPIMFLWFIGIATLGGIELVKNPQVLAAVSPTHAVQFFITYRLAGFLTLGAVVLCVTGAEALYADMGHFGKRPIRVAWFALVLPSLLLNYFGQGALLLNEPSAAENPFFHLAPRALLWPLVVIATLAAIVASQALISGAFSLAQQSIQLGYLPRATIIHTSKQEAGQIYVPQINRALMIGCLLLVVGFQSSSRLSAAYGIAVTGTMGVTSLLFYVVARYHWRWRKSAVLALTGVFLLIDASFFLANIIKVEHGGWVPLAIAVVIYVMMDTWKRGREHVWVTQRQAALPLDFILHEVAEGKIPRVPGTAVFLTAQPDGAPVVMLHHLKHNKVLHRQVVLLTISTAEVPEVPLGDSVTVEKLGEGFARVRARSGFMQTPNVPDILQRARHAGLEAPARDISFYLGRDAFAITRRAGPLAQWRKRLYAFMSRNAPSATEFFSIPPGRVVEMGAQMEL